MSASRTRRRKGFNGPVECDGDCQWFLPLAERELQARVNCPSPLHGNAVDVGKAKARQPNRLVQKIVGMGNDGNPVSLGNVQVPGNILAQFGVQAVVPAGQGIDGEGVRLGISVGNVKNANDQPATALVTQTSLKPKIR